MQAKQNLCSYIASYIQRIIIASDSDIHDVLGLPAVAILHPPLQQGKEEGFH